MILQLLQIKELREANAARDVKVARRTLEELIKQVQDAKQALVNYITWRKEEEHRLYAVVLGEKVTMKDLKDIKQKVAALRNRDMQLQEEIHLLERKQRDAAQTLSLARQVHSEAQKAVEKYMELAEQERQVKAADNDMKEDLELEEFGRAQPAIV